MKDTSAATTYYVVTLLSLSGTVLFYFLSPWNFGWLLSGGPSEPYFYHHVFWAIVGKILLFLPLISLPVCFFVRKTWYFALFATINIFLTLLQLLFAVLPST
jgi:hypothetical protein